KRTLRSLRGQPRRVRDESSVQRIGIDLEYFVERCEREPASLDAVVAAQNHLGDGPRAPVELLEPRRLLKALPAVRFGVAAFRVCGAQTSQEHSSSSLRVTRS